MIKKLLIANRGEIAVRIIRAARELGIVTVAVYSEADRQSLHTAIADEAYFLGEAEPVHSYLHASRILDAAKESGADAIHPGYGFLSERPEFAEACETSGIIFVGPSSAAMRKLGAKIDAKNLALSAGVPIAPGFFTKDASVEDLLNGAEAIGYPVMLKASAGGGGRGMRIVRECSRLAEELALASEEAKSAFGDGSMMVEKLIERPRHIEVQFLADGHGEVACLYERECSIQRRHQKLIEESPSVVGESIWPSLRESVQKLARAAGYTNAGTCEFLMDPTDGKFYFLEVNARLQVEHPVTEMVTGTDLVQWQLRIASGEHLDLATQTMRGDRSGIVGHAIEARVVAEDPRQGFLPSVGTILAWSEPKSPGVRIDTGFGPGSTMTRYYDSLIAKVISHAETRPAAISRLRTALLDFHIVGVKTNLSYLVEILDNDKFRSGSFDTGFIAQEMDDWNDVKMPPELANIVDGPSKSIGMSKAPIDSVSFGAWVASDDFRNA